MQHNRRNNNNRRFKNNNQNKRRFGGGGGSNFDDESANLSIQQRKNFANKYDQYMQKAKDILRSGDRIEAENYYQHADHCFRMMNLGLTNGYKFDPQRGQVINPNQQNNFNEGEAPVENAEAPQSTEGNSSSANDISSLPFMREPIPGSESEPRVIE